MSLVIRSEELQVERLFKHSIISEVNLTYANLEHRLSHLDCSLRFFEPLALPNNSALSNTKKSHLSHHSNQTLVVLTIFIST